MTPSQIRHIEQIRSDPERLADFRRLFASASDLFRQQLDLTRHLNITFLKAWNNDLLDQAWEQLRAQLHKPLWLHYFVRSRGLGDIKIGKTNAIDVRFRAIVSMSPRGAALVACYPGDETHESELKEEFARDRLNGEWFFASHELLAYLRMIGSDVDDFDFRTHYHRPRRQSVARRMQ